MNPDLDNLLFQIVIFILIPLSFVISSVFLVLGFMQLKRHYKKITLAQCILGLIINLFFWLSAFLAYNFDI